MSTGPAEEASEIRPAGLRFPALAWALLHVPLVLLVFLPSFRPAVASLPSGYRPALWPAFAVQGAGLALLAFALGLPFSFWPRVYRVAAPALIALAVAVLALDAQIFLGTGFHVNGFVVRSLLQPAALREIGIPVREATLVAAGGLLFLAADTAAGAWFLRRFASPRRAWPLALALLGGVAAERLYTATLAWSGGSGVFAAGQTLPLQVPLRMGAFLDRLTGRPHAMLDDPFAREAARARDVPSGVTPESVRFERRPDVVVAVVESLRAEFLDAETMPRTWRRAQDGTLFETHVSAASSTTYTLFGLLYGLQAQKMDAVVGAGRPPLLFGALRANGYQLKVVAASSVDWMGLKDSVFARLGDDLETGFPGAAGVDRDEVLLERTRARIAEAPLDQPLFLFLFFDGTHFNYGYRPRSARFGPVWDGAESIKATRAPGELVRTRARNSAYEVDWKLDEVLDLMAQRRGRAPLVFVTGDHSEEFKEKGRLGHGTGVNREQVHVPMAIFGEGVPPGRHQGATSHVDFVPTLLRLLGDRTPPERYCDGIDMFQAGPDRFVLTAVGWEPVYALVSRDLKVA
ncbi:MAG TPA: sulfatase-like hydrolase/transferase, partial [Anaeromyxobacteraceae bacterium]|nr:sulfatase-like hydrolase/transferase [Anaeromyxobacteraceae bacterium]